MTERDLIGIGIIVSGLAVGLPLLLWPRSSREDAQQGHAQLLRNREARGSDAYFEERRELEAYPPPRSALTYRLLGGFLFAGAVVQIFNFVTR